MTVDPAEVARSESCVEELTQRASQLRRTKAETEDTLHRVTKDLATMKMNLQKFKMEIDGSEKQQNLLRQQEKSQEGKVLEVKSDPVKVKKFEAEIEKKESVYKIAADDAEKVESEVAKIHKQIVTITGGKMKGLKSSLAEINKKLEKVTAEITRLTVAIKTAKRNTAKTEEKLTSMKAEKEELEKDMIIMTEKRKEMEKTAADVLEELHAATEQEDKLKDNIGELKAEHDVIVKKENKIKASKIEIDQELEKFDGIVKENKAKYNHWKKKLAKLELQDVPLTKEGEEQSTLEEFNAETLVEFDLKKLESELEMKEEQISQSRPNLAVIQEYRKKEDIYLQRVSELDEITTSRDTQRKHHDNLRKQRLNEFMSGFSIISNKLKEMYQMITLGGDAELELVDSLDPFSEGIVFR